ncbi:unnamed protein product, partial [Ixodes persulcatus]
RLEDQPKSWTPSEDKKGGQGGVARGCKTKLREEGEKVKKGRKHRGSLALLSMCVCGTVGLSQLCYLRRASGADRSGSARASSQRRSRRLTVIWSRFLILCIVVCWSRSSDVGQVFTTPAVP